MEYPQAVRLSNCGWHFICFERIRVALLETLLPFLAKPLQIPNQNVFWQRRPFRYQSRRANASQWHQFGVERGQRTSDAGTENPSARTKRGMEPLRQSNLSHRK